MGFGLHGRRVVLGSLVFTAICLFGTFARGQDHKTKHALKREDAYLTSETAHNWFRGAVLVGINGKIEFEKGYGFADEEWKVRNSPGTRFRIASMTKQFTAACILLLQERGRLNVHDPISKYLTNLPEAWQPITIHQLLTHTSGIPEYTDASRMNELFRTGATPQQMIDLVADMPLQFKPGSKFSYTNTGYILLGMMIEKVSGESYAAFLDANIFGPLGMADSGYDEASEILSDRASGYDRKDGRLINADFIDMSVPYAAGGIYSTVEDLYRWNEGLANRKLLSAESLREMFQGYPETASLHGHYGYQGHYGYGVGVIERFDRTLYYHGGGVTGFSSYILRFPREHICIVVLSNDGLVQTWALADHIAADLFDQPSPPKK
jgi:CubicO group peptidase (beta-lactamase class C family)